MDISFYQMGDLYKQKVLLKEYIDNSPVMNSRNSYQTTASMQGPGNGPHNATDGSMAQFGDKVMFPEDREISNSTKAQLLIKFFKEEIDEGTWDEETKTVFGNLLEHLLGLKHKD